MTDKSPKAWVVGKTRCFGVLCPDPMKFPFTFSSAFQSEWWRQNWCNWRRKWSWEREQHLHRLWGTRISSVRRHWGSQPPFQSPNWRYQWERQCQQRISETCKVSGLTAASETANCCLVVFVRFYQILWTFGHFLSILSLHIFISIIIRCFCFGSILNL